MPPLSPERLALAAAISAHAAAVAHVERVRAAKIKAWQIGGADRVEAAAQALVKARQAETTAVLAGLLDQAAPPGPTVAEAEQALAEARSAQAAAEQARTQLLHEEDSAERRLRAAEAERAAAIGSVLAPAFEKIFAEFDAAQQRAADLRVLVQMLPGSKSTHQANAPLVTHRDGSGRGVAQWRAALTALEMDPAAPLPDDIFGDDPEPSAVVARRRDELRARSGA
jgi:hypothetical protein